MAYNIFTRSKKKEEGGKVGKVRKEEKLEVKRWKGLPLVIRQVSGSEQLNFMAERWLFIPRLVT